MKAIAVINATLHDTDLPLPQPGARDLQVRIDAISVNPVDHKVRAGIGAVPEARVLGWDAAGTVTAIGEGVTLFQVGDQVYYAGSIVRAGANSEFHLVDERVAARKPASLDFAKAAALPLTSITAWEALFDRLGVARDGADQGKTILVVGGAGGVGSIAIQLAKKLAQLTVVATASRPESSQWCKRLGADHVIDHHGDIAGQLKALQAQGVAAPDFILCLNEIDKHFPALVEAVAPQGRICSIVHNEAPLELGGLFGKSATLVFELMFTRSSFETADMIEQHKLLTEVATLVDAGVLVTTVGESFGKINAANIERAHQALLGRHMIGKIVLSGF